MNIYRTFEAPKGYARIYSARPFAEAEGLAQELYTQGRIVALIYHCNVTYAVYAKV